MNLLRNFTGSINKTIFYPTQLFVILDSVTTYYSLDNDMAREGSPAVRWVIEQLGLGPGLIARTLFAGTLVYVLHRVPDDHAVKSFGTGAALLLNLAVVVNNMLVIIK